ncbi:glycosyltransferase family 2 protein [Apiospora rasikravindrae]|uniref:Glycosyltransferase family 2 protein n=1 Tax=Apiospora rasikravindrae TaxID=990691 RepID=A0ABR1SII1_9PEZI
MQSAVHAYGLLTLTAETWSTTMRLESGFLVVWMGVVGAPLSKQVGVGAPAPGTALDLRTSWKSNSTDSLCAQKVHSAGKQSLS